jgi:uncharacterized Zn-binding protein involved in type VI secretion
MKLSRTVGNSERSGTVNGQPAAIKGHRGYPGADGPRGTFHRPVLYTYLKILILISKQN